MTSGLDQKLRVQLRQAMQELERLEARLQNKADYGPGKGDPAIYEWEFTLAMRETAQARVETIRQAILRCKEGRYGICEQCGAEIDPERLDALPLATKCISCARSTRS
jgi:DnaK suppressor protein